MALVSVLQPMLFLPPNDPSDTASVSRAAHEGRHCPPDEGVVPVKWSVATLAAACDRKRIAYTETDVLTTLRGLVVTAGDVSRISVRAGLSEPEKVAALAHELAHVALAHDQGVAFLAERTPVRAGHEEDAAIWAAHLLVLPEVWEESRRAARDIASDEDRARSVANDLTAVRLGIPLEVVELWERHRDATFAEDPRAWLARS